MNPHDISLLNEKILSHQSRQGSISSHRVWKLGGWTLDEGFSWLDPHSWRDISNWVRLLMVSSCFLQSLSDRPITDQFLMYYCLFELSQISNASPGLLGQLAQRLQRWKSEGFRVGHRQKPDLCGMGGTSGAGAAVQLWQATAGWWNGLGQDGDYFGVAWFLVSKNA